MFFLPHFTHFPLNSPRWELHCIQEHSFLSMSGRFSQLSHERKRKVKRQKKFKSDKIEKSNTAAVYYFIKMKPLVENNCETGIALNFTFQHTLFCAKRVCPTSFRQVWSCVIFIFTWVQMYISLFFFLKFRHAQ